MDVNSGAGCRWPQWIARLALVAGVLMLAASTAAAQSKTERPDEGAFGKLHLKVNPPGAATEEGYYHFYNLEYQAAIEDFQKALDLHPNNPFAANHLLEAVLFSELHREGKLDAQLYLSNEFVHMKKVQPDEKAIARVKELSERARSLERALLKKNPKDVSALYAKSVTRGLHAAEEALVGKEWLSALRNGLGAYEDANRVLHIDPNYSDAKLIVGIYNYVVGSLPWAVKLAALIVMIHGSRAKGLRLIREAAAGGGDASIDAHTTLALFLAREDKYAESLKQVHWLYRYFPHNFLYGLSEAGLLNTTGKVPESIRAYHELIRLGRQGWFPQERVGMAALNLGNVLRDQKDWREAAKAYDEVQDLPNSTPDLVALARLQAGKMYDRVGERKLAVQRYREVIAGTKDEKLLKEAKQWLKEPYTG